MGSVRPGGLALVASLLLFWTLLPPAIGQGAAGHMVVSSDYELFGLSEPTGGGHVTWTLTEGKAVELRNKILHMFDEYPQIPRGFTYGGAATSSVPDGRIEAAEGLAYTDRLENELEGLAQGGVGTDVGYVHLDRFDLIDKDPVVGFNRSTAGILGTNANSTENLQIRFLFNGFVPTTDRIFRLPTRAYADALHKVFSFAQAQAQVMDRNDTSSALPLLAEDGWHIVTIDGRTALWAGNDTTGFYDDGEDAAMRTFMDPILAPLAPGFDLRFATAAWLNFSYRGQIAGPGDRLLLEAATDPAFVGWTMMRDLTSTGGSWQNVSLDLSTFGQVGTKVRFRFHFVSDGSGVAPGFYVRDFSINAPSLYSGEVVQSDAHYVVGTLSFSAPNIRTGSFQLVRTPGGEILWYTSGWDAAALPADSIRFRTFDVTENPQILFGIMLVASYAISRLQDGAYDRYREAHPSVYRPAVHKVKWLHNLGRVAIGVLILFYFVPTALGVIGLRIFVSGPAYWFLSLTLTLLVGFVTRAYYRQKLEEAPPPVVGETPVLRSREEAPPPPEPAAAVAHCTHCLREVLEGDKTYNCTCGAVYHLSCAAGLMRCSNCRKPIAIEVVREKKVVSMRCESCGELQVIPEGADPRTVTCERCGGRLRHLDEGKRYLIVASNPAIAFAWMQDLTKEGKPSLCLSPAAPDRLRLEFGNKDVQFLQVSSQATNAIDPRKLDPAGLKAILPLARQGKGGVILYDGLDRIISEASMGDVIRFLRKANDMAFVHGVTVIGRVSPRVLADPDLRRLRAEFDEYMDLSAQM